MWINAAQSDLACLVTGDTKLAGLLGLNMRLLLRRGLVCRPPGLARGCLALAQGGAYVVKRGWLALEIGFAVGALAPTLSYVAPPLLVDVQADHARCLECIFCEGCLLLSRGMVHRMEERSCLANLCKRNVP